MRACPNRLNTTDDACSIMYEKKEGSPVSTHEHNLERMVAHILQELLAGREPSPTDIEVLTGDVRAWMHSLTPSTAMESPPPEKPSRLW
jgi:hypothetical protein